MTTEQKTVTVELTEHEALIATAMLGAASNRCIERALDDGYITMFPTLVPSLKEAMKQEGSDPGLEAYKKFKEALQNA